MKLHTENLSVQKSEHLVEKEFSIKATRKAFSILSSGLYSDKILAIVRELSCNAWDAHVEAGNTGTKFEIKLPTSLDPTFHVKDYGTGLSHEDILELYTTYFDSTKADCNDYIGALGLGSKSPFSYVSTFSIESRHKGTRRLYTAFIGEKGVPQIVLNGEEKTDEPNGMTVSLATKSGDANNFNTAARKALMYFDPLPKVYGGGAGWTPYELKHTVKGTNWRVRQSGYYAQMTGAHVVQGFVAYPIDRDILHQANLEEACYNILGLDVDFSVPIGAVEIAASREALSYTPATIKNLAASVQVAADEMRDAIQKEIDECKTLWDASMLFATYTDYDHKMHRIFSQLHSAKDFKYKGKKLDDAFALDLAKIKDTMLVMSHMPSYSMRSNKARKSGSWDPSKVAKAFSVKLRAGTTVLVDDVWTSSGILTQYLTDLRGKAPNVNKRDDLYVVVIKGTSRKSYNKKEVDSILAMLGNPSYELVSALPYTKVKTATTYRARKIDEVVVWKGYPQNGGYRRNQIRRVYSRLCWEGAKVDPQDKSKNRYFVELDRFTIINNRTEMQGFDTYLEAMRRLELLPRDCEIIGLTEKQVARVKSNKKWLNVFSHCKDRFADMNKDRSLLDRSLAEGVLNGIGNGVARHIVFEWTTIRNKVVDGSFKNTIEKIHTVYEASSKTKWTPENIRAAAAYVDKSFDTTHNKETKALLDEFANTMDKHAMLRLVDWSRMSSKDVNMIIDYVNFVAKG